MGLGFGVFVLPLQYRFLAERCCAWFWCTNSNREARIIHQLILCRPKAPLYVCQM